MEKRKLIVFNKGQMNHSAIILNKITKDEIANILYLKCSMNIFLGFVEKLRNESNSNLRYENFVEIQHMLSHLLCFLFDLKYTEDINIANLEGEPIPYRQHLIREFSFIEMLTDVIYLAENVHFFTLKGNFWMERLIFVSHTTLRLTIREYRPNELFCSQWLDLILEKAVKGSSNEDNYASST